MPYTTLAQAMNMAAEQVAADQSAAGELFAQAVAALTARRLRADVTTGVTRDDQYGVCAYFPAYDWAHLYAADPSAIYHDFFRPWLLNSVSRLRRDLAA